MSADQTGIDFRNDVTSTRDFNIVNYMYFYDGAGVAAGDVNNDGLNDLFFVENEVDNKLYLNRGNFEFDDVTEAAGVAGGEVAWSTGVTMADVTGDGRIDLVGGNHGENSIFKANAERPVKMWVGDMAGNGMTQQILSYPKDGRDYPVALRHDLIAEIPVLVSRYPDYASYGGQTVQQIFSDGELSNALALQATELRSMIFWNEEGGFRAEPLPVRTQLAPMYGIHLAYLTGDGADEILLGGNLYHVKPQAGPY